MRLGYRVYFSSHTDLSCWRERGDPLVRRTLAVVMETIDVRVPVGDRLRVSRHFDDGRAARVDPPVPTGRRHHGNRVEPVAWPNRRQTLCRCHGYRGKQRQLSPSPIRYYCARCYGNVGHLLRPTSPWYSSASSFVCVVSSCWPPARRLPVSSSRSSSALLAH